MYARALGTREINKLGRKLLSPITKLKQTKLRGSTRESAMFKSARIVSCTQEPQSLRFPDGTKSSCLLHLMEFQPLNEYTGVGE